MWEDKNDSTFINIIYAMSSDIGPNKVRGPPLGVDGLVTVFI
jgi:hypothetical protein